MPSRPARLKESINDKSQYHCTMAEKNVKKHEKNIKKSKWAFVAYPESLPRDWKEQLQRSGVKAAISPLHDKDLNPDGTVKKPHYHVILCYDGPTTYNSVKSLTNGLLGQTAPQPLEQVRGYYRYLTHEDNPEKVQYSKADIQTLNGFDIRDYVEKTASEVLKLQRETVQFIRDNDITEYSDLIEILMDGGETTADMFEVASSHTLFYRSYILSRYNRTAAVRIQPNDGSARPKGSSSKKKPPDG